MQHVLETGKRALSAAVAAATIAFSIGAGVLVSPAVTQAATAGSRFKGSLAAVYYMGYDGMRYTYVNTNTYASWHMTSAGAPDFSGITTLSDSAVADIDLGGNVLVRGGTFWGKITSDAKLYAIARHGKLHWIESEDVAKAFRGSDWNSTSTTIDIPDVFFTDYSVGTSLMDATAYDGMLYEMGGDTYLSWDGEARLITSAGMSANGYHEKFVMDGTGIDDSALSMGDDVTSKILALTDVAQTEEGDTVATGDVTVSAASSMPAGASVPMGANALEAFRFNVKAGAEDAVFDGLTLTLTGAGATTDLSSVYLYNGDTRLTESRTVNSSTRQVTFSSLEESIDAGDTETYTVRVTVSSSATAANTFGFKIADDSDVVVGGDVGGSFPISGNTFTITGSSVGEIDITKSGTISDPTIGEQDAEIGQFKITASGSEGAEIQSITLKIDQAADHDDFRLYDGSTLLVEGVNTTGDQVVFDLSDDPFVIEEGGNNIFSVTADVGGQDNDTIKVYVDNAVDVVAVGSDFGFGLTVDIDDASGYDGSTCTAGGGSNKCSVSTIVGGELTLTFNGPSAGEIQTDSQDQTLLAFTITAAQEVTIKDLDVIVYGDDDGDGDALDAADDDAGNANGDDDGLVNTGTEANLKDIKIVNADTGAVVMGPLELDALTDAASADDADQTIDFTDDFTMDAGETLNLEVRADIDNGVTSGTEFAAAVDVNGGLSVEDQNGDALSASDIVPGSDITGYNQEATSASLAFTLATTPTDTTTVDGTDDVEVLGMTTTVGDASDVTITSFTLTAYGVDDASDDGDSGETFVIGGSTNSDINDYIESCSLYEGTTLLAGPEAPGSSGQTIIFSDIDWNLDAGAVTKLTAKCNFANDSTSGRALFSFDINDASEDVVAEDESGDAVTATGDDLNGATDPTTTVNLLDSGSLAVALGSDTPSSDFVLTSSSSNHVSTYRFTATNEAFTVQTLEFTEDQAGLDSGTAGSSIYANNISLVTITYPKADGTTGTKTAVMSGNAAVFSGLDMYVPTGSPKDVKVYVNVPLTDRDSGGSATSDEKIRMGFSDGNNSGTESFKAVGSGSGETLTEATSGINDIGDESSETVGTFVVRETKPTVTLSSSSPSGSAVVGRSEVLRFNVAASSNEDVVLEQLMFKMSATDNAGTPTGWNDCDTDGTVTTAADFDIYNLTTDGTTTTLDTADANWSIYKSTGAVCDTTAADLTYVKVTFPTSEVVPKGSTYTFALYFDATGASASADDSLRFDIPTDPIVAASSFLSASALNEANLTTTDTVLTVLDSSGYTAGDVVCMDTADDGCGSSDEKMLVNAIIDGTTMWVTRGYLGTLPNNDSTNDANDDIDRVPGSFFWQDDGTDSGAGTDSADDFWGSYLVDNLTLNGGTLVF